MTDTHPPAEEKKEIILDDNFMEFLTHTIIGYVLQKEQRIPKKVIVKNLKIIVEFKEANL